VVAGVVRAATGVVTVGAVLAHAALLDFRRTHRAHAPAKPKVVVHSPGGDNTLVPGGFKGAGKLNLQPGGNTGKTNASIVDPHELAPKGFGGGY